MQHAKARIGGDGRLLLCKVREEIDLWPLNSPCMDKGSTMLEIMGLLAISMGCNTQSCVGTIGVRQRPLATRSTVGLAPVTVWNAVALANHGISACRSVARPITSVWIRIDSFCIPAFSADFAAVRSTPIAPVDPPKPTLAEEIHRNGIEALTHFAGGGDGFG